MRVGNRRPPRYTGRPLRNRFMPVMNVLAPVRVVVVVAAAALTACAQSTATDGTPAEATAARPTAAGRNTYPPPPPAPPPTQTAMTVERARGECWMKLESDKKAPRDLDRRLKLVETCVADKMSAATREQ